jgi:large subunit ribosomal protein L11
MSQQVESLVEGGKANPGPPLGPALGPLGINIGQVIQKINEKTKQFDGMKVPVKVVVDPKTKEFDVIVGTPPTSALILGELNIEKGSGKPNIEKVGDITMRQIKKIAGMKKDSLLGKDIKARVKEVIGTCASVGVTVEGKEPGDAHKAVDNGAYDEILKE